MGRLVCRQESGHWESELKGVFQTKISPAYDDVPESQYHFPRMYLNQVRKTVGDWIVYYEPRRPTADVLSRGGRQSYFAVARVTGIREDRTVADHFYADISDYLPFDRAVPFRLGNHFYEDAMRGVDGRTNSDSAQRAVRVMPDREFELILHSGFAGEFPLGDAAVEQGGFADPPEFEVRNLMELTVQRPFRDAIFS